MLLPESMKWVALFLLVVQNTALVLLMRSSLTAPGEHYIVTTAVACMEVSLLPGRKGDPPFKCSLLFVCFILTHHKHVQPTTQCVKVVTCIAMEGWVSLVSAPLSLTISFSSICLPFSYSSCCPTHLPFLPPSTPTLHFFGGKYVHTQKFKLLPEFLAHLRREILKPRELLLLSVPSLLYTLQNNLLYIALANLDAAIYQVCYQLKILTTALFSVILLKRALSRTKWISLIILTVGVSLTELDAHKVNKSSSSSEDQSPTLGFLCVLMACLTSGFAGVWFEKILKNVGSRTPGLLSGKAAAAAPATATAEAAAKDDVSTASSSLLVGAGPTTRRVSTVTPSSTAPSTASSSPSITASPSSISTSAATAAAANSMWIRNIQMGATSVAMALLAVYSKDGAVVAEKGFFYGYNWAVVGVILLQALGGLVVALVVVHADNIMKGFGSSISIVLSCTLEWLLFDFQPSLLFVLGAGLVNVALFVYQLEGLPRFPAGGSGVARGGGKEEGKGNGNGGVIALLGGLVGMREAGSSSSGSGGSSSFSTPSGGGILPSVHIPKSHARDVKGWFNVGSARKAALSPPAASAISAMYLPFKNSFDIPASSSSSNAGGMAEWRQAHAAITSSRGGREGGVKELL